MEALRETVERQKHVVLPSIVTGPLLGFSWRYVLERAAKRQPGGALLYRGIDCEHWRERYEGARVAQVFLHDVNQLGPYAAWRFDKREGLGLTIRLPI